MEATNGEIPKQIGEYSVMSIQPVTMVSKIKSLTIQATLGMEDYGTIPGTATVGLNDIIMTRRTPTAYTCVAGLAVGESGKFAMFHHVRSDFSYSQEYLESKVK